MTRTSRGTRARRGSTAVATRRVTVAVAILGALAVLASAATAGTRTSALAPVGDLGQTVAAGKLDYTPDRGGRLRPVSKDFIAQNLGLSFADGLNQASQQSSSPLAGVRGAVNLVTTPTLQCVNGHQTADPLSPPCVPNFTGDNGGATYRGVSRDEVRVLVRFAGGIELVGGPPTNTTTPTDVLVDLDQPPAADEQFTVTKLRIWQTYFNRHLQLYGRHLHLFVYFDGNSHAGGNDAPDHQRRAALALLWSVNPFAVIQAPTLSEADDGGAFLDTFAKAGVVAFDPVSFLPHDRLDRVPNRIWGYIPTADQISDLFGSYVCQKVVGQPVALSGNPAENGTPRRLGLLYPDDTRPLLYKQVTAEVRRRLSDCGAPVVASAPLPADRECGEEGTQSAPAAIPQAAGAVQAFKTAGVTTVLWLGCNDEDIPAAAVAAGYLPEWILLGDGFRDETFTVVGDNADVSFDHHAVLVTWQSVSPRMGQSRCYAGQREVDPSLPADPEPLPRRVYAAIPGAHLDSPPPFDVASEASTGCFMYPPLLQAFGAIQLGGPRLTANSLAAGLHGLPYQSSPSPETPSCFYGDGHSCIRDAVSAYWDAQATCFHPFDDGRRHLAARWPTGNVNAQPAAADLCTGEPE